MKQILIKPIFTERMAKLNKKSNNTQYGFVVALNANKIEIKHEIERMYDVNILSVRTSIMPPVTRRRYTKSGVIEGKTKRYKKAFITLKEPKVIEFESNSQ